MFGELRQSGIILSCVLSSITRVEGKAQNPNQFRPGKSGKV